MREHGANVREGDIAHGEVSSVAVSGRGTARRPLAVVTGTCAEHSVGGVVEVHVTELMSVIGSGSGGAVVSEGDAQPFTVVGTGEVDRMGFVTNRSELCARTVKGNSLAGSNLNLNARVDGQVGGHNEVIVGWVDANWAVNQIPVGVGCDVSHHIGTLAFVWHDPVVGGTVRGAGREAVVVVVIRPERSNQSRASNGVAAVRELRVVPCPNTSLNVGVAVVDEVHVTLTTDLHPVVGVITVVRGVEV